MSNPEQDPDALPPEVGSEAPSSPPIASEADKRTIAKIVEHLAKTWGYPAPCPYCRNTSWNIDPHPVILQRFAELPGFGIPVFLVWCTVCGNEVQIQAALTGLWDDMVGLMDAEPVGESASQDEPPDDLDAG